MTRQAHRVRTAVAMGLPWLLLAATLALVFGRLRHPSAILPLWRPWAEVGALAVAELDPPGDIHASPAYRQHVGAAMVERALRRAREEASRG